MCVIKPCKQSININSLLCFSFIHTNKILINLRDHYYFMQNMIIILDIKTKNMI